MDIALGSYHHKVYFAVFVILRMAQKKETKFFNLISFVKMAATYSSTWYSSTIGANGLNFSVRNGKRWSPVAIATLIRLRSPAYIILREIKKSSRDFCHMHKPIPESLHAHNMKPIGLLVLLGFDITAFTPTAYRRGSLPRPSREVSSWG